MKTKLTDTEKQYGKITRDKLKSEYGRGKGIGTVWYWMSKPQRYLALKAIAADMALCQIEQSLTLERIQEIMRAYLNAIPEDEIC